MAASFPAFSKLPTEIRFMIWTYALPERRVFEILDTPSSSLKTPASDGLMFANRCHEPPPALAAVCLESRAFVLRHYKALKLSNTIKYIDLSRDILLLEPYLLVRRLLRTLHFLALMPHARDQIHHLALGTSYGFNTGLSHPALNCKTSKKNRALFLQRLAKFPRLKKLLFIVHQEFQFSDPRHPPHRPLLLYHSYPFKSDSHLGIKSCYPCFIHRNEFVYYPIKADGSEEDDFDLDDLKEEKEEDDWRCCRPNNDDWRRFKRRFLKGMYAVLDEGTRLKHPALKVEGASLLWIYHQG